MEFRSDGSGRLTVTRSKTDQEGEEAVQYLGRFAAKALRRIRGTDPPARVFGLRSGRSVARRLAAVQVAGRWASSRMPASYARGELAACGAVAQFYVDLKDPR